VFSLSRAACGLRLQKAGWLQSTSSLIVLGVGRASKRFLLWGALEPFAFHDASVAAAVVLIDCGIVFSPLDIGVVRPPSSEQPPSSRRDRNAASPRVGPSTAEGTWRHCSACTAI
jgi:hypothetical protein